MGAKTSGTEAKVSRSATASKPTNGGAASASASGVSSTPHLSEEELLKQDSKCIIRLAPPRSTRVWDVLIVLFYHMLPFTPVPLILIVLLEWKLHSMYGWAGDAALFSFIGILATTPLYYDRRLRATGEFLYTALARYMIDVRILVPAKKLENQGPHIFAVHPHGRMFYTCSMMIQTAERWREPFLPAGDFFGAAAAGFFAVPILRQWLYAIGAMPASKQDIVRRLRQKNQVAIIVGGVKEVCLGTNDDCDELYLKNRKGFARIAVDEKVGVIPIYCFNENQLFRHDAKWKLKFWEKVNKYINIGVPFMRGIWGLPMPFRRELLVVVGDPLYPREGETGDQFLERYIVELEKLFARYVGISPHPEHKLVIT